MVRGPHGSQASRAERGLGTTIHPRIRAKGHHRAAHRCRARLVGGIAGYLSGQGDSRKLSDRVLTSNKPRFTAEQLRPVVRRFEERCRDVEF